MADVLPLLVLGALLIVGELIFRRKPGAGGLLYNLSGTLGGIMWVLAGAFLIWGGAYWIGGALVVIGVNIHRSNFRIVKQSLGGTRGKLNG